MKIKYDDEAEHMQKKNLTTPPKNQTMHVKKMWVFR